MRRKLRFSIAFCSSSLSSFFLFSLIDLVASSAAFLFGSSRLSCAGDEPADKRMAPTRAASRDRCIRVDMIGPRWGVAVPMKNAGTECDRAGVPCCLCGRLVLATQHVVNLGRLRDNKRHARRIEDDAAGTAVDPPALRIDRADDHADDVIDRRDCLQPLSIPR